MTTRRKQNQGAKEPWTAETQQLALERAVPDPGDAEGAFPFAALIPLLGPLLVPVAKAIGERVGSWIAPKKKGAGLMRTMGMGLKRTQSTTAGSSSGPSVIRGRYDFVVPARGRDVPQPTIGSYAPVQQPVHNDKFQQTLIKGTKGIPVYKRFGGEIKTDNQALEVIKGELEPYVNDPAAFKKKLSELVRVARKAGSSASEKEGKKVAGSGLVRTVGKGARFAGSTPKGEGLKRTVGAGKKKK